MKTLVWTTYSHHLPLIAATVIFSWVSVSEYKKLSDTRQFVNTAAPTSQQTTPLQQQDAGKVSELDLFGTNIQPIISAANSNIKLNGIFMATPKEKSSVALTVNGGDEKLYKSGESIKGGGRITQIAEQYILVLNNGKPTKILLTMEDNSPQPNSNPLAQGGYMPEPTALPNVESAPPAITPAIPTDEAPAETLQPPQMRNGQFIPGPTNLRLRGRGRMVTE